MRWWEAPRPQRRSARRSSRRGASDTTPGSPEEIVGGATDGDPPALADDLVDDAEDAGEGETPPAH